jgi:hypothetical protein
MAPANRGVGRAGDGMLDWESWLSGGGRAAGERAVVVCGGGILGGVAGERASGVCAREPRESGESGGSLQMSLNSCRDMHT